MKIKYPRTPHLPWSPGMSNDDRVIRPYDLAELSTSPTTITEKMDGGNVTLMRDCFYARSLDSGTPVWEKYAKNMWSRIAHDIPDGWRISAESVWAQRSVAYTDLPGPLLVFGVWDTKSLLSWPDTMEWAALLGLPTVPVIGESVGAEQAYALWRSTRDETISEGFVVRDSRAIPVVEFPRRVAKWVREGHVQTDAAWRHRCTFPTNMFAHPPCT